MGIPVHGPQVIAFLEWLRTHRPTVQSLREMSEGEQRDAARSFVDFVRSESGEPPEFDEHAILDGAKWRPPPSRSTTDDLLRRYRTIKYRSLLLYSKQDKELGTFFRKNWDAWSEESGDLMDFYDFAIRGGSPRAYSFSQSFIRSLRVIHCADIRRIQAIGLPCLLLWSNTDDVIVPFADVATDPSAIRDRFRNVLRALASDRIDDLKAFYDPWIGRDGRWPRSDIFISYQHTDKDWVGQFHDWLERDGFQTWYDQHLCAGERFDLRIRHQLEIARAAVVVWSEAATRSDWVVAEAEYARSSRKLVPVARQESVPIPPPFNTLQTVNMSDWPAKEEGNRAYTRLRDRLTVLCHKRLRGRRSDSTEPML